MSHDDQDGQRQFSQSLTETADFPGRIEEASRIVKKHDQRFELLILSEAGKPIYSYTKREDAVTLMPLCSALMNYAKKAQGETLKSIRTSDNLIIHFTTRSPLIIIVIHEVNSSVDHLMLVDQVEAQVISILTAKTLNSLFEERPTFDLKRLLYGSEKLIDATTNLCAFPKKLHSPWVQAFLAVDTPSQTGITPGTNTKSQDANSNLTVYPYRILIPLATIPSSTRDSIHNILNSVISGNSKNMVFSLLFKLEPNAVSFADEGDNDHDEDVSNSTIMTIASETSGSGDVGPSAREKSSSDIVDFELLTLCNHHDRYKIKTADIHIVLALLSGSRAQLDSVESLWMPICLPKFNQDAFVHSYIAYINEGRHCLVLISIDREEFTNCQKAKDMIEAKLESLMKDSSHKNRFYCRMSPLVNPTLIGLQDKLVGLRKRQSSESDEVSKVQQQIQTLATKQEPFQLQFLWHQTGRHVLWWQRSSQISMSSVIYYMTKKMLQSSLKHLWLKLSDDTTLLGWHMPTFQLYAQFDGTITANEATEVIQRITSWVKKEEDNFSIKDYR